MNVSQSTCDSVSGRARLFRRYGLDRKEMHEENKVSFGPNADSLATRAVSYIGPAKWVPAGDRTLRVQLCVNSWAVSSVPEPSE